jgi:hypothetical protein
MSSRSLKDFTNDIQSIVAKMSSILMTFWTLLIVVFSVTNAFNFLPATVVDRTKRRMTITPVVLHATLPDVNERKTTHQERQPGEEEIDTASSNRRALGRRLLAACTGTLAINLLPQFSHLTRQEARAGLLDEFGTDPTKIVQPQKVSSSSSSSSTAASTTSSERGGGIDPTLRASYYYPTAKKRYLPRIQKVTVEMPLVSNAIQTGDWEIAETFTKTTAENAILPLQLYVSSLDGQGLSMSNSYAKQMKGYALEYERLYKVLARAVQKRDANTALQAISDMGVAVADYRQTGRLKDDDGNIPSVDEMKRMAMRKPTLAPGSFAAPTR